MRKETGIALAKRHTLAMLIAFTLALLVAAPALASDHAAFYVGQADDTINLTWNVAPSDQYTVTFIQATPFIFFNTCLTTNTSYTVNFSVTVDTQAPYDARFLTQDLYPQEFDVSFAPASVAGSSTMTFAVTATFRTPNQTTASNSGFVIALERLSREPVPGGPPFDETYLGVLAPCIVAADQPEMPGKLPDTGVDRMISLAHLIAYVIVALSLLITGVYLRQRLMLHG